MISKFKKAGRKIICVRKESGGWYDSIQCEFALNNQIMVSIINTAVGIDMGVKSFLTVSNGSFINRLEERLKPPENKIALQQRRIRHKDKKVQKRD